MQIDGEHPWDCPIDGCGYTGAKSKGSRSGHLRMRHGFVPVPATDEELAGATRQLPPDPPMAHAAQDQDVADALKQLTATVQQLVDREPQGGAGGGGPAPAAPAAEYPTLAQVLTHCESGTCAPHAQELEELKAKVVQAAYDNMPEELVREKAELHNLIPKSVKIVAVAPAAQ